MSVDLEAHAGETDGVANATLAVDREAARDDVEDFAVRGDADHPGRVDYPSDVGLGDLAVAVGDGPDTVARERAEILTGQPDDDVGDRVAGVFFGFGDGCFDGLNRLLRVDQGSLPEAQAGAYARADHLQLTV